MLLESLRRAQRAGGMATPEAAARARTASSHLMLRHPGWPWQEHDVLRGLFGPEDIDRRVRGSIGFGVEDAIRCTSAISNTSMQRVTAHMRQARTAPESFGPGHPAFEWACEHLAGGWKQRPIAEQAAYMPLVWALNHVGEALVIDAETLAGDADVPVEAVAAFLQSLAIPFGQDGEDWFAVAEQIRAALRPPTCSMLESVPVDLCR